MRLILGYIFIFGIYFLVKGIMFMPLKIVPGIVQSTGSKEVTTHTPRGPVHSIITYPIIAFKTGEAEAPHILQQEEVLSFKDYSPGTAVQVAYNPSHIENAFIYSVTEYWVPLATMLVLCCAAIAWTAAFYFVRRFMTQGR